MAAQLPPAVAELLAPYLEVVGALNERGRLRDLSGFSRAGARMVAPAGPIDRLRARTDKRPRRLSRNFTATTASRRSTIDGWTALEAYVPPKERRGLVLVDPPFEAGNEFVRLSQGLAAAHRKWPTGIYLLWYPIKGRREADALAKRLRRLAHGEDLAGRDPGRHLSVIRRG